MRRDRYQLAEDVRDALLSLPPVLTAIVALGSPLLLILAVHVFYFALTGG